jgi:hypothetical protein
VQPTIITSTAAPEAFRTQRFTGGKAFCNILKLKLPGCLNRAVFWKFPFNKIQIASTACADIQRWKKPKKPPDPVSIIQNGFRHV